MAIADVIKYEGDNSTFIWKHPCEDFNSLTQLIVHESQEAIFFMNGQALDLFGAGRYTLETQNIPLIGKALNRATGDKTPFHCEVYFINKTEQMSIKWGTDSKVQYIDPTYGFPLSIGASGEMSLRAEDSRKLLLKLVGTENFLGQQKLVSFFRAFLMTRVKTYIAQVMKANAQNSMRNAQSEDEYKKAASIFNSINGFKDADTLAEQCLDKAEICRKDAIYVSAKSSMTGEKIGAYETAIKTFQTISGWKDADEQIYVCQRKIEEIKAKEEADRLEAQRKAEERRIAAEKAAKKRKKIIAITIPIVCACIAFIIVLNTVIIPNAKYNKALMLIDSGDYEPAYMLLNGLNYKDSETKLAEIKPNYNIAVFSKAEVGSTVFFGAYEQDNNTSNGKEDIEWRVLAKEDNKILVISEYALDCQQYNTSYTDVTWENCSLRKWMNGTFLNNAFSADEQAQIQSTNVSADKNPKYSTNPGNATTDKVFLLSITEAEKYFTSDEDRKCVPTAYAIAQGARTSDSYTKGGKATCWWWLRSPGYNQDFAALVYYGGSVSYGGYNVNDDDGCVRPALWINLE